MSALPVISRIETRPLVRPQFEAAATLSTFVEINSAALKSWYEQLAAEGDADFSFAQFCTAQFDIATAEIDERFGESFGSAARWSSFDAATGISKTGAL